MVTCRWSAGPDNYGKEGQCVCLPCEEIVLQVMLILEDRPMADRPGLDQSSWPAASTAPGNHISVEHLSRSLFPAVVCVILLA